MSDKVNIEIGNKHKYGIIHFACFNNHIEIVKIILNKINLEAKDEHEWRPIYHAYRKGYFKIVVIDGFIDDKFYNSPSKVNLNCLTFDETSLDLTEN